jgi:hypothetical protein
MPLIHLAVPLELFSRPSKSDSRKSHELLRSFMDIFLLLPEQSPEGIALRYCLNSQLFLCIVKLTSNF